MGLCSFGVGDRIMWGGIYAEEGPKVKEFYFVLINSKLNLEHD